MLRGLKGGHRYVEVIMFLLGKVPRERMSQKPIMIIMGKNLLFEKGGY